MILWGYNDDCLGDNEAECFQNERRTSGIAETLMFKFYILVTIQMICEQVI